MSELDDIKSASGDYYKWALKARKKYLLLLQQYNHLQREVEEYHFSIYILFYM